MNWGPSSVSGYIMRKPHLWAASVLAAELEKSRLQQEKNRSGDSLSGAAPAIDKSAAQPQTKAPAKPHRPNQQQHEQQSGDFKAQAAGEPGKKKPAKTQRSEKASADAG